MNELFRKFFFCGTIVEKTIITFENDGTKSYGIVSQDCKNNNIYDKKIYQKN